MRPSQLNRNRSMASPARAWKIKVHAALVLLTTLPLWAQPPHVSEYDVKAAYLFNFGKFLHVTPAPARASFTICVLGRDPMGPALDSITRGEEIDSRPVRVQRMHEADAVRSCDIAYISASEGSRIDADLAVLRGSDVLTVSDAQGFLDRGGMIQFVNQGNHIRFSVNLNAVRRTHLVLSSELLKVAAAINGKPNTEVQ